MQWSHTRIRSRTRVVKELDLSSTGVMLRAGSNPVMPIPVNHAPSFCPSPRIEAVAALFLPLTTSETSRKSFGSIFSKKMCETRRPTLKDIPFSILGVHIDIYMVNAKS